MLKNLPTISRSYQNTEDIETKMFKYFQRFPFIETNRYLFKAFKEEKFDTKGWVQNLKFLLDMFGLGNLGQNIYKIINGIIPKEEYKSKHKFFKKRATDLYLQIFYNDIDNTESKGFFTCLKGKHKKEKYLDFGNMEIRNVLSKLRLSSFKLAIVTGKWFETKEEERICKFCDLNEVEDETHLLLQRQNYKDLQKGLIDHLISTENINLTFGNKLEKLKLLFVSGSWGSLNALGKFVLEAYKKPTTKPNTVI